MDAAPVVDAQAEALVLVADEAARLHRSPDRVLAVYGYSDTGTRLDFLPGTDWLPAGSGIARTASSRIPDFAVHRPALGNDVNFDFSPAPRNPH